MDNTLVPKCNDHGQLTLIVLHFDHFDHNVLKSISMDRQHKPNERLQSKICTIRD